MKKILIYSLLCALFFSSCAKQEKKPVEMSFNELKTKALELVKKGKNEEAIEFLDRLVSQYPENQDIFEYKFMLADLYLKVGRLDAAYKVYKNYTLLYPSESRTEEAHYKSILSKFYQTLKINKDCDDTDTQKTIKQCEAYLGNKFYNKYRNDVKDIKFTCESRLIDKEVYVFNTYIRRKKYQSAKNRIENLRANFMENHPYLEAKILYMESKLAYKSNKLGEVKEKIDTLNAKFPESQFTKMAHNMVEFGTREFQF